MTNHPPSVLWHCWLGHQTCKNRRPYNLYCVGADVKPCSIKSPTEPLHNWPDRDKLGHWKCNWVLVWANGHLRTHWLTCTWPSVSASITGIREENFLSLWSDDCRVKKLDGNIPSDACISETEQETVWVTITDNCDHVWWLDELTD